MSKIGLSIVSKSDLLDALQVNSKEQKNAVYSNSILVKMLESSPLESVEIEPTRNGFIANRGSLCEALVKSAISDYVFGYRTLKNSDVKRPSGSNRAKFRKIGLNPDLNYEVKFTTSFALASVSKIKTKYVILVVKEGAYLVESKDYQRANYPQGKRLNLLSQKLGF